MVISTKKIAALLLCCLLGLSSAAAEESFHINDLRLEGLQRVSPGSVFAELDLMSVDQISRADITRLSKQLYATGLFDDLAFYEQDGLLILRVTERPTLQSLEITGNQKVSSDDLRQGLSQAGLETGQIFQRSTLEQINLELQRMYHAQGRYTASITSRVEELPRNQVRVHLEINEGSVATIQRINIVGNQAFDDATLLGRMELKEDRGWTLMSSADQYSREKLNGDLERLRSWYLDRGYLRFNIESTQVSISPDKQHIYITINVHEGEPYTISEVELAGNLILEEDQLRPLIRTQVGQPFSRSAMTGSTDALRSRLSGEGYTFADINAQPVIDDEQLEVKLVYQVQPGRRMYVRRIQFRGNTSTQDEVLRREMLQMEGASANSDLIDASRARLERLGFFSQVSVDLRPVPGSEDLLDITYSVEEQPSGSIQASIGYSQNSGIVYGASISQRNFLGTGNTVSMSANKSDFRTSYNFSYLNPYYTIDGVSRGFNLFYRETDFGEMDVTRFATDAYGANVTYGYPISRDSRVSLSLGFDQTDIYLGRPTTPEIQEFTDEYGLNFFNYKLTGRWTQNRLNRGVLPTAGSFQRVSLEVATPGSDYQFYKLDYRGQRFFPIGSGWSLKLRTDLGYGGGIGSDYSRLPFYEHYYAGGLGSVRGYRSNSLGYRPDNTTNAAFGGNILLEGSAELIFPLPFIEDQRSLQTSFFIDAGGVFTDECYQASLEQGCEDGILWDEIRYSAGVSLTWITAIGPLSFSLARPLNDDANDRTEVFQFSLGQTF
ncbi:outer membrane protein assembly factor BamA [Marinospirillum sp.]|uniref:outer membrane protein assembly factor BamA n=1 Tax=Marinospirillum sp. TaxID=2183934 RepID=UPI003A85B78E